MLFHVLPMSDFPIVPSYPHYPHTHYPQMLTLDRDRDYRGTSLIRKRPPPWDPPRTLGIGLR